VVQNDNTLECIKKLHSTLAHTSACPINADSSVIERRWKMITLTNESFEKSESSELWRLLPALELYCFRGRIAAPAIYGIGYVTRGTIISVSTD
jgi:hypothetical protein